MNSLFVAWRPATPAGAGWRPVGRLEHDGQLYRFWYTRGAQRPDFRPFSQMQQLDQVYESVELFPLFANRLLSESRPRPRAQHARPRRLRGPRSADRRAPKALMPLDRHGGYTGSLVEKPDPLLRQPNAAHRGASSPSFVFESYFDPLFHLRGKRQ